MRTTIHRTTIVGQCPHGCPDTYDAEFHIRSAVVMVEDIQKAIDCEIAAPVYQELLTLRLAELLKCKVVTRGRHGNFLTECTVEPE